MNTSDIMSLVAGLLQFAVAGYALRLSRVMGPKRVGWSLFTAFLLLAVLHLQSAAFIDAREQTTILIQAIYSLISLLLLVSLSHLETLLKERMRHEQEEIRLREELKAELKRKTAHLSEAFEALQEESDQHKQCAAELAAHIDLMQASWDTEWLKFKTKPVPPHVRFSVPAEEAKEPAGV
jgi:hypothetical protein